MCFLSLQCNIFIYVYIMCLVLHNLKPTWRCLVYTPCSVSYPYSLILNKTHRQPVISSAHWLPQVRDYLCDAPMLLQLLARGLGNMGGLVWLFFFRVALCCVGTVVSISTPPLEALSSTDNPLESDPSLCGLLGVLDDVVVVVLLLICVININQQIAPESGGRHRNARSSGGVMGSAL